MDGGAPSPHHANPHIHTSGIAMKPSIIPLAAALSLACDAGAQVPIPATGTLDLVFASRPAVCSPGRGMIGERRAGGHLNLYAFSLDQMPRHRLRDEDCVHAPVHVTVKSRGGAVTEVVTSVEDASRATRVSAAAGARTLLRVAATARGRAGEQAVLAVALADSVSVWRDLLGMAEDARMPSATRRNALYWGGRLGGPAAAPALERMARDGRQEQELREHALMTLSKEMPAQGIAILTRMWQGGGDEWLRAKAVFWIGQSDDPAGARLMRDLARRTDVPLEVRSEAVFALGNEQAGPGAAALIREIWPTLEGGDLRQKALIAMHRIGGAESVRWLRQRAADASQPEDVRILAGHLAREAAER
jgi:hypothetical protein